MPALQVRDFPADMYETLKAVAARNHRSIAQQTIAFVEQGIAAEAHGVVPMGKAMPSSFGFDTEAQRAARIERRKELFAEIGKIEWRGPKPTAEEIVAAVREGHERRDQGILEACGFHNERTEAERGPL